MLPELAIHFDAWKLICAYKRPDVLAWHTPNGEKRDARTAARLQAMGVVRGVGDFVLIVAGRCHFIELKTTRGQLSRDQEIFRCDAERAGATYHVARSVEDVARIMSDIGASRVVFTFSACGGPETQPTSSPRGTEAPA